MTAPDPLAEVARLRDPAGPWLHLLWGAPADARQFGWLLARKGLVARVLRGPCLRTPFGLFDEAAAALQFPGDLVADWPAFRSLLGDLSWLPGPTPQAAHIRESAGSAPVAGGSAPRPGHVLVITSASLLLAAAERAELASFVAAVAGAASARITERRPALHVVLADDAVGLATLRARLVALPAGVRDVVGWRPEEPPLPRAAGSRVAFQAGAAAPDEVDETVLAAMPAGVVELRRGWEEYRGPAPGAVRTYGVVLERPELAVAAAGLISAATARFDNGACVVLPIPREAAAHGDRVAAFLAASSQLSPRPQAPPPAPAAQPTPAPTQPAPTQPAPAHPAPALPGGRPHDQRASRQEPDAPHRRDLWTAGPPVDSVLAPSSGSASGPGEIVAAEPEPPADQGAVAEPVQDGPSGPAGAPTAGQNSTGQDDVRQDDAGQDDAGRDDDPRQDDAGRDDAGHGRVGPEAAPERAGPGVARPAGSEGPRDVPGTAFELVTANLEWEFSAGAAEHDPADAAVVALARNSGMFRAVFRTWTRDPAAGWVRVLIGYAAQAADPARAALVAAARTGGAARTCVEVVPPAGLSDVHRWLEQRCVLLYRAETYPWPAPGGSPRPPAAPPSALDPDSPFRGGPAEPDEAARRLIAWAARRPAILGVVVAETGPEAAPQRVYGVVLDAAGGAGHDAEDEAVRAEARAALGDLAGRVHIEPFAPSRGLSPLHLRLYRGSTRLWTRRAERPSRTPAAGTGPAIDLDPGQRVERTGVQDELLDGGLTLVGLTRTEPVAELSAGERDGRDECDRALVEWAGAHPDLLAVTRSVVTVRGHPTRVYLLAVDPDADRPAVRRGAGAAMLGRGLARCGVELFCPLEPIPRFHLDLYNKGARLWRSDRTLGRPASTPATGQPAADR